MHDDLDELLALICVELQLTPTMHENAVRKYTAVCEWLEADGSPLHSLHPILYPQGSMALGTTVRPLGRAEYDLDMVLQATRPFTGASGQLYTSVWNRLSASGIYKPLITPKNRCIRINYAGEFHLDVLPARQDYVLGGTCIEVPDRERRTWVPSNPLGFVKWFDSRCAVARRIEKGAAAPVPAPQEAHRKPVLKRIVQLMKRRRDRWFLGDEDDSPASIILTTLAGRTYFGEESLVLALLGVLERIDDQIKAASPHFIRVTNPANETEVLSDKFNNRCYPKFAAFIAGFRAEVEGLLVQAGIPVIAAKLDALFGEESRTAVRKYGETRRSQRQAGILRAPATGLVTGGVGQVVRSHNFFGGDV